MPTPIRSVVESRGTVFYIEKIKTTIKPLANLSQGHSEKVLIMTNPIRLSVSIERYDRFFPFYDDTLVCPDHIKLDIYQTGQSSRLRDGKGRHERMLLDGEFDVAEFSFSTFLMARERGLPITGIPIFPRRLFSLSQMWVHQDSPFTEPKDLLGRKVAISAFQNTLALLAKGDLKFQYDTPWEQIHWLLTKQEKVKFSVPASTQVDFIGGTREELAQRLVDGHIDAFFLPHPPHSVVTGQVPVRRLIPNCPEAELDYFHRVGDFPIMHVIAVREDIASQHPNIGSTLYQIFDQAQQLAATYYEDPAWSRLAWGRHYFEQERAAFGRDPWANGFAANRKTIERLLMYSHDQGMIASPYPPETLFLPDTLNT